MIKKYLHTIMSLALLSSIVACTDEIPYDDRVIGPGEAIVSASIDFHPLVATVNNTGSRASQPGDLISTIDDLTVFLYDVEGNLQEIYNGDELEGLEIKKKNETGSNTGMPNDAGIQAEESTARATFTIKGVPFGQYRMYAVANVEAGGFEDNATNRERFAKEKSLRDYKVEWNEKNIGENDQMFGYFTPDGNDEASDGFQGPILKINKPHTSLHAWIKRAASKVTIVYDGSGLHQGVFVYIKSVKIMDIPRYCKIGNENWVKTTDADSMIVDGGIIYYAEKRDDGTPGELPEGKLPTDNYTDWMRVAKGTPLLGAVSKNDQGEQVEHSEYAGALYFYENCQGNYPGQEKYNKHQNWDQLGYVPQPGDNEYKDNIPYGTYIEVDAYYVSTNPEQVSNGPIKYRFMLGQDTDYDYDAFRNHHYKLTLGFKGWANQPDWHIVYKEPEVTFFTDPTYYISYSYNQKAIFPVRFKGDVESFDVEIVENNWAPYDKTNADSVPAQEVGIGNLAFKWNRPVYKNADGKMYYGLQKPYDREGKEPVDYTKDEQDKGAPSTVTPIWAGFLALQVPDDLTATILVDGKNSATGKDYWYTDKEALHDYYYNNNQNWRTFSKEDFDANQGTWVPKPNGTKVKTVGSGNNKCEIVRAPDGSTTVNLPTWTRPKSMLSISGFTGNNPYDTYQRKAIVKLTAKFKGVEKEIVKYMPIFQVRRVVNPKGVWRQWDDNKSFTVKLLRREGASADNFSTFKSEGAWRAYVATTSEGADGFISLVGGVGKDEDGAIIGYTDTPVEFTIQFNGMGQKGKALCGIVRIEYHGFTCNHSIFVRQGYYEPITIMDNAKWSSFSLYSCDSSTPYKRQWTGNESADDDKKYIDAVVTASPLSLGTLFKRGNYAEGILIKNNAESGLGPLDLPGTNTFSLTNNTSKPWGEIEGIPYYKKGNKDSYGSGIEASFNWSRFKATVNNETRYYRLPTYNEYHSLLSAEYGIGVLYADGATEPAVNVDKAYSFEDFDNNGVDETNGNGEYGGPSGMRGFIVFNPTNAHQIFFPLGARGIGRRTLQGTFSGWPPATPIDNAQGVLRYGASPTVLNPTSTSTDNNLRPIPYNLPASPGAIYWLSSRSGSSMGWDMNYFDLNFNQYDGTTGFYYEYTIPGTKPAEVIVAGGDALPIKLVRDDSAPSK